MSSIDEVFDRGAFVPRKFNPVVFSGLLVLATDLEDEYRNVPLQTEKLNSSAPLDGERRYSTDVQREAATGPYADAARTVLHYLARTKPTFNAEVHLYDHTTQVFLGNPSRMMTDDIGQTLAIASLTDVEINRFISDGELFYRTAPYRETVKQHKGKFVMSMYPPEMDQNIMPAYQGETAVQMITKARDGDLINIATPMKGE